MIKFMIIIKLEIETTLFIGKKIIVSVFMLLNIEIFEFNGISVLES